MDAQSSDDERRSLLERLEILDGYVYALDHLDEIFRLIQTFAGERDDVARQLAEETELTREQADAVSALQFLRLSPLQQARIRAEHADVRARV